MKKAGRGLFKSFVHKDLNIQLTRWQDKKKVTIGSNYKCDSPSEQCQRWSYEVKVKISVLRPKSISSYNKSMGGTDSMDQAIYTYNQYHTKSLMVLAIIHFHIPSWDMQRLEAEHKIGLRPQQQLPLVFEEHCSLPHPLQNRKKEGKNQQPVLCERCWRQSSW